jgi:hypothetical protein
MAKKNSYKSLNLEDSKREISNNLDATNKFDLDNLTDDIEYITSSTGQIKASVVASIEAKMDATIIVLKETVEQLKSIKQIEGDSTFIQYSLEQVKEKINDIKNYYEARPASEIEHRYHRVAKVSKKGVSYEDVLVCANAPTQIKTRSRIFKILLELKPMIDQLENNTVEIQVKGKEGLSERLKINFVRNETIET